MVFPPNRFYSRDEKGSDAFRPYAARKLSFQIQNDFFRRAWLTVKVGKMTDNHLVCLC